MKKMKVQVMLLILIAYPIFSWSQSKVTLDDYLNQSPSEKQSYEVVKQSFKQTPSLDTTIQNLISWHIEQVQKQLMKPMQKLMTAVMDNPLSYSNPKEYKTAEEKFIKIAKSAIKMNDDFRKATGDDKLAAWIINAAAFLETLNANFSMYEQNQLQSFNIGTIVLVHYTGKLLTAVNQNKSDDESLSAIFLKGTDEFMKWVNKIPSEKRK